MFWRARGAARERDAGWALGGSLMLFGLYAVLPVPDYLLIPPAFALLVYGLATGRGLVGRCLTAPPLLVLGEISYSTYMIHYFIKTWTKFLFLRDGIPLSVAAAIYLGGTAVGSIVFYHLVEVPGRRALRAKLLGRSLAPSPFVPPALARNG